MLDGQMVTLRPLNTDDAASTLSLRLETESNKAYMGYILPVNEACERRWIEGLYASGPRSRVDLAIVEKKERGAFVGLIGLSDISPIHQRARFGIILKRDYHGRGYARDAMRVFLDYALFQLNLERIGVEVLRENERAIALYRQFGFQDEGVMRRHHFQDGARSDVQIMGLLRSEYVSAPKAAAVKE
jgi:ribosomal-protein-alanine N-acetyltransferase